MKAQLILHPTDGSDTASKALEYGADLAVSTKAKLLLLHVQPRRGENRIPKELKEFERIENIWMSEPEILAASPRSSLPAPRTPRAKWASKKWRR